MGALDAFYSTWSDARETFGQGTPQDGAKLDNSSQLMQMKAGVEAAAPDGRWQGPASEAYGAKNQAHAGVYGKLAELDTKMAAEVTNASNVVTQGRQSLENTKSWVDSAANSIPTGTSATDRDSKLLSIANQGIGQVSNIVTEATNKMTEISQSVQGLKGRYDAIANGKPDPGENTPGEKPGEKTDMLGAWEDRKNDSELVPEDMEGLVHDALNGNQEAAAKVDNLLGGINEEQLGPKSISHPLNPVQAELIGQMQAQMKPMSMTDLDETRKKLGPHQNILADAMQVMSDPDVTYPRHDGDGPQVVTPGKIPNDGVLPGDRGALPDGVQKVLNTPPVDRGIHATPDSTDVKTTYPTGEDLKMLSGLIQSGDEKFQQGTELDRGMMDRAADILRGAQTEDADNLGIGRTESADSIAQSIFNSAGRDDIVVHDTLTDKSIDPVSNHPRGEEFLRNLTTHDWTDDGQAARTLTDWIDDAAKSNDPVTQLRAGETAQSIADYLGTDGKKLLHLQESTLNNWDFTTAGERNPALIQSYAEALIPYQGELVGEDRLPGFHNIEDITGSDLPKTRDLFAVLDSDKTAANNFNAHAFDKLCEFQEQYAALAGNNPNLDGPNDIADQRSQGMARAGLLGGLIDGGALTEASAREGDMVKAAQAAYDLKKNAIGYVFGLGTNQLDHLGGFINAMGKDPLTEALIGVKPSNETIDANPNYPSYGPQYYENLANYSLASQVVEHHAKETGVYPPPQYLTPDGRLLSPQEVVANAGKDPRLGPEKLDDYYHNLETYLQSPVNGNLAQSVDQFGKYFDNSFKKPS